MSILADIRIKNVIIEDDNLAVEIMDGRTIKAPLAWYPRLFNASAEQLITTMGNLWRWLRHSLGGN